MLLDIHPFSCLSIHFYSLMLSLSLSPFMISYLIILPILIAFMICVKIRNLCRSVVG
jgi:hypothetical protein